MYKLGALTFALIIAITFAGLRQAEEASGAEGLRLQEEAIMRALIHCYAVEGFFPDSLDYIATNYGIYIDYSRFIIHYEIFASNILPDLRVFKK